MGTERGGTPQGEPVNVTGAALCHTGSCQCRTARSPSSAGLHHPAGAITDHHYTPATEATLASHDSLFDWVGVGAPHDFRTCMSPADTAFTYLCLVHLMLLKCAVTVSQSNARSPLLFLCHYANMSRWRGGGWMSSLSCCILIHPLKSWITHQKQWDSRGPWCTHLAWCAQYNKFSLAQNSFRYNIKLMPQFHC